MVTRPGPWSELPAGLLEKTFSLALLSSDPIKLGWSPGICTFEASPGNLDVQSDLEMSDLEQIFKGSLGSYNWFIQGMPGIPQSLSLKSVLFKLPNNALPLLVHKWDTHTLLTHHNLHHTPQPGFDSQRWDYTLTDVHFRVAPGSVCGGLELMR